jgi:putative membrane protein
MFMVAWMASLLYLPRLFVYHADKVNDKVTSETFKIMEHRLYYYIGTPSLILVWLTGLYLAYVLGLYGWLIVKFFAVIIMTVYHIWLIKFLKNFKDNVNTKSSLFFRKINEVPFLILLIILIMVIIKPEFS